MPVTLRACVIDANVLIDLEKGRILPAIFGLPLYLMAPDFLLDELPEHFGDQVRRCGLVFVELSGDDIDKLGRLRSEHPGPTITDLAALVLARKTDAWLLTGERSLRSIAEKADVTVHGTLWLLDEMVRYHIITPPVAAQALQLMLHTGSRFPAGECNRRLARWKAFDQS